MRKTTQRETDMKLTTDLPGLMAMLGAGRQTAVQIAEEAGAGFKVGRRRLYLVSKVEQYLEGLTQE